MIFRVAEVDGVALVTIDVPGRSVNTWTLEAVEEFAGLSARLAGLAGVIFLSGKKQDFHSGGDLALLGQGDQMALGEATARLVAALDELAESGLPSVAAIDGHCLGGGLELALACRGRIATRSRATVIGLPECSLGLMPGAGGSQRLPRLIGAPAVELILTGRAVDADEALRLGIVDAVFDSAAELVPAARELLRNLPERPARAPEEIRTAIAALRSGGFKGRMLPGRELALQAMAEGAELPLPTAIEGERRAFLEAIATPEAQGSLFSFLLGSEGTRPPVSAALPAKVGLVGFGTMGRGIAVEVLRRLRVPLIVKDEPAVLEAGLAAVRKILTGMKTLPAPVDDLMALICPVSEFGDAFRDVDLVIEAVFEQLDVKRGVLRQLGQSVSPACVVATNTSSIPLAQLSDAVEDETRFAGLHFFSPVWRMELVEVVRGPKTSESTIESCTTVARALRKRPVVCRDHPGFIVNAMLLPYFLETYALLEQGVEIEQVDRAMTEFGMPVGPVRLIDEVGLDVQLAAFEGLSIAVPHTLRRMVADGRLGLRKSGRGFFLPDGNVDPKAAALIPANGAGAEAPARSEIADRLYLALLDAGHELLRIGVVGEPETVDRAMLWGVGFPSFRGGPLKWADLTGLSHSRYGMPFYQNAQEATTWKGL